MVWPSAVPTALQLLVAVNNTKVVLGASAGIGDTVIVVDDASPLPASGYLTFDDNEASPETIYYTGKTGTTLTGVTRGADDTSVAAHTADGSIGLEMRWNAAFHNTLATEVIAIAQNLSDRLGVGTDIIIPAARSVTVQLGQIIMGQTRTVTLNAPIPATTSRIWTIPDISADGTFAALQGAQTFTGTKTFAAGVLITAVTNQLVLGTTNTVTLTAPAPAASRVLTIPDPGGAADFVLTAGNQTIGGTKTFSTPPVLSDLTATTVPYLDAGKALASSAVTPTELGCLSGVTSAIQTQIGAKLPSSGGTVTGDVTLDNQKALILKELTANGSNAVTLKAPADLSASYTVQFPTAGPTANKQVQRVLDFATGTMEWGTGGGQGGINYILNPDAEADTSGFAAYADAAGTTPVDGTGGSPNVTITRVTSAPLRGTAMFRVTKDAANRQGQGVAYAFTIDAADKAKVLSIAFDYLPSSAFVPGNASDIQMWVYDVTNAVLIPVTPYTIQGGSSLPNSFKGSFQTSSNSTSYRLIFHIATTNASAWTFDFDNVSVGPQAVVYGAPITDWASTPLTANNFGTISGATFWTRRVGGSLEGFFYFKAGTVAASLASLSLPSGLSVDIARLPGNSKNMVGRYHNSTGGAGAAYENGGAGVIMADSSDATKVFFASQHAADASNSTFGSALLANAVMNSTGSISGQFDIPILGWGSNVLMSNDADTRVVAAGVYRTAALTIVSNTDTEVVFDNADFDTHGAYSISTGRFTAPVSGYYRITGSIIVTTGATPPTEIDVQIRKNGVSTPRYGQSYTNDLVASKTYTPHATAVIKLTAGEYVSFWIIPFGQNITADVTAYRTSMYVEKVSGPSAIAATEFVGCHYSNTAATVIGTGADVPWPTLNYDTHGAMNTATGVFTAPVAGKYLVCVHITVIVSMTTSQALDVVLYKNGSSYAPLGRMWGIGSNQQYMVSGSIAPYLLAGETIKINALAVATAPLTSGAGSNYITISKLDR